MPPAQRSAREDQTDVGSRTRQVEDCEDERNRDDAIADRRGRLAEEEKPEVALSERDAPAS